MHTCVEWGDVRRTVQVVAHGYKSRQGLSGKQPEAPGWLRRGEQWPTSSSASSKAAAQSGRPGSMMRCQLSYLLLGVWLLLCLPPMQEGAEVTLCGRDLIRHVIFLCGHRPKREAGPFAGESSHCRQPPSPVLAAVLFHWCLPGCQPTLRDIYLVCLGTPWLYIFRLNC